MILYVNQFKTKINVFVGNFVLKMTNKYYLYLHARLNAIEYV